MVLTKEINGVTHYFLYCGPLGLAKISQAQYNDYQAMWDRYGEEVAQLYIDRGLLK